MSDVSDLETYGRLSLWLSAVSECKTLLNLSKKSSESAIEISKRYNGSVELHHGFPSFIECMQMANYNKMLAVIFFSQAFNIGNEDSGVAAKNTRRFIEVHLENIISEFVKTESEKEKFYEFKAEILTIRNQVVGHADAPAFKIKHEGKGFLSQRMHCASVKDIDIDYWIEIIEPLWSAILKYMAKFQPTSS